MPNPNQTPTPQPQPTPDYDALARQAGAVDVTAPVNAGSTAVPSKPTSQGGQGGGAIDYDALARQAGAVTSDVSDEGTPTETGITKNQDGSFVIAPKPGESFADTMKRAAAMGQNVGSDLIQSQAKKGLREAPAVLAAAPVVGAAGAAGLAGAGEAVGYGWEHAPEIARAVLKHVQEPGTIFKFPYGRAVEYYLTTKLGLSNGAISKIASHLP